MGDALIVRILEVLGQPQQERQSISVLHADASLRNSRRFMPSTYSMIMKWPHSVRIPIALAMARISRNGPDVETEPGALQHQLDQAKTISVKITM